LILKRAAVLASLLAVCLPAHASMFHGETLDAVADVLAWVILVLVPIVGIVLFWLVHILPEQIAEKRHHPQQEAIKTLCLLSLVFGGLLWPIAWLWAYTRPVGYRLAYGTEKHESWFEEMAEKARVGVATADEMRHLREELEAMQARGALPAALQGLMAELKSLQELAQARRAQAAGSAAPAPAGAQALGESR
jgi:CBS domain containing-hemolysin-like protein